MSDKRLKSNIWKLHVLRVSTNFMLAIPIIVPFFRENGMNMKEIFLLESLFSIAIILMEIPAGYFSDMIGRKKSMVFGSMIAVVGHVVYALGHGFWEFFVGEMFLRIGLSFFSSSNTAILWETLAEQGKEGEYLRIEGKRNSLATISLCAASVTGGFLALISLRFPFYVEIPISLLTILLALSLFEPQKRNGKLCQKSSLVLLGKIWPFFRKNGEMRSLIFFSSFTGASTLSMFWLTQPCLENVGVPLEFFGTFFSGLLLVGAAFSLKAHVIEKALGKKKILLLMGLLPILGYFLLGFFRENWSLAFILLFYFTKGLNDPITLGYINGLLPSEIRATILSVKNLIGRVVFSAIGPIVGWINDSFSLQAALFFSGAVFLTLTAISLFLLRKNKVI